MTREEWEGKNNVRRIRREEQEVKNNKGWMRSIWKEEWENMSKKVHKNTKYCSFKKFVMFRCFKNVKCTPGILISLGSTPKI